MKKTKKKEEEIRKERNRRRHEHWFTLLFIKQLKNNVASLAD